MRSSQNIDGNAQGARFPEPLRRCVALPHYRCSTPDAWKAVALPPVGVKFPLSVAVKPPARICLANARSASVMQPLGLVPVSDVDGIAIVVVPWLSVSDVSSNVAPAGPVISSVKQSRF